MGYGISITITDKASPLVAAFLDGTKARRLNPVIGRAGVDLMREHMFDLAGSRHRKDSPTNFYRAAAGSAHYTVEPGAVVVSVNSVGIAQRFFGGDISPVNGKYLTIPARAEAYGKRAREFTNLEVIFGRGGKPIGLGERESVDISIVHSKKYGPQGKAVKRGAARGGLILFWLVESVHQDPDPEVLPSGEDMLDAVETAATSHLDRIMRGAV